MIDLNKSPEELLLNYIELYNKIQTEINSGKLYPKHSNLISDYNNISTPTDADVFFEKYGVGNLERGIHNPFERQNGYELLLYILNKCNQEKFQKIHKGTPYYFIAWTSYQYQDFAKAIYYMDAAVSEDLKFFEVQNRLTTRPSLDFFLLNNTPGPSGLPAHLEFRNIMEKTFLSYKNNGGGVISIDLFREKFINVLLYSGIEGRSLLTALYTFILEYPNKEMQIKLRSNSGGSIQPFIDHLFDGGRILESLLETHGARGNTLRNKINYLEAEILIENTVLKNNSSLKDAEFEYKNHLENRSFFQESNFSSAFIIRNTTGHSLLWPDQFTQTDSYTILYNTLINSIFWTIEKLWLSQDT
jgi:hypothetical protein